VRGTDFSARCKCRKGSFLLERGKMFLREGGDKIFFLGGIPIYNDNEREPH